MSEYVKQRGLSVSMQNQHISQRSGSICGYLHMEITEIIYLHMEIIISHDYSSILLLLPLYCTANPLQATWPNFNIYYM